MKTYQSFFILLFNVLTNVSAFGQVIGYGSADSVLPAKNQEAFFTGFELGLIEILGKKKSAEILIVEQVTNGSPSGAVKALKTLKEKGAGMIVGFPTSHEALQVAQVTSKENYLTIFSSAGHSSLSEFGPNIFTTGESMKSYINSTYELIEKRFKKQKGIFIYNPQAVFSVNQKNEFQKFITESKSDIMNWDYIPLNPQLKIDKVILEDLKSGKYKYVFLSPYADESAVVLGQLNSEKIDLPIISNSSWTTGDIEFVRRFISDKKTPILTGAVWVPGMSQSKYFEKLFKSKYGTTPTAESASGYDLGVIVGNVVKRAKGKLSKEDLFKAFHSNLCFDGTTVGQICFPKNGGHGDKKILYMQMTKSGLKNLM